MEDGRKEEDGEGEKLRLAEIFNGRGIFLNFPALLILSVLLLSSVRKNVMAFHVQKQIRNFN